MVLSSLLLSTAIPATDPSNWIIESDYPVSAMEASEEGAVGIAIEVDVDGKPIACVVDKASLSTVLNSATCSLLMDRAKFRVPVAEGAVYKTTVQWNLRRQTTELAQMGAIAHMKISADGIVTECTAEFIGPVPKNLFSPCRHQKSLNNNSDRFTAFKSADLRLLLEDHDDKSIKVTSPPKGLFGYMRLNQSIIEIDPRGVVVKCTFIPQWEGQPDQHCSVFHGTTPDFKPKPAQKGNRKMTFTTDLILHLR